MRLFARVTCLSAAMAALLVLPMADAKASEASAVGAAREPWSVHVVGPFGLTQAWEELQVADRRFLEEVTRGIGDLRLAAMPDGDSAWLAYAPKPLAGRPEGGYGIALAEIRPVTEKARVSTRLLTQGPSDDEAPLLGPFDLSVSSGGPVVWYLDPFREELVRYGPNGSRESTQLPDDSAPRRMLAKWRGDPDPDRLMLQLRAADSRRVYLAPWGWQARSPWSLYDATESRWVHGTFEEKNAGLLLAARGDVAHAFFARGIFVQSLVHYLGRLTHGPEGNAGGADSQRTSVTWKRQEINVRDFSSQGASVFVDRQERPHLFYQGGEQGLSLMYAWPEDGEWGTVALAEVTRGGRELAPSGMVDRTGGVHAVYYDFEDGTVYYARTTAEGTTAEPVAKARHVSQTALLLTASHVIVAYADVEARVVKVALRRRSPDEAAAYQTHAAGELGWVDIQEHAQEDPETVGALVSSAQSWVTGCGQDGKPLIAYAPSSLEQDQPMGNALAISGVDCATGAVTAGVIDENILFGPADGAARLGPLRVRVTRGAAGVQVWYIHPFRRSLVRHGVAEEDRREWPLPEQLLSRVGTADGGGVYGGRLDFAPDVAAGLVHFAFEERTSGDMLQFAGSLRYGSFDLESAEWKEEEIGPIGSVSSLALTPTHILCLSVRVEGYVGDTAPTGVFLYERPRQTASQGGAQREGGRDAESRWTSQRISPEYGEVALVVKPDGRPSVILGRVQAGQILHLEPDHPGWRREVIWQASAEDVPRRQGLARATLALSATLSEDDALHVAFYDPVTSQVRHVWCEGSAWKAEAVAAVERVVSTSIRSCGNRTVIAFCDVGTRRVHVACRDRR